MPQQLKLSIGQHSEAGRKDINQDFHGALIPKEPKLSLKGVAVVLADVAAHAALAFMDGHQHGILLWSSSRISQENVLNNPRAGKAKNCTERGATQFHPLTASAHPGRR